MSAQYTLLGHPISGSISPCIHNTAFNYYNLNCTYTLSDIPPQKLANKINEIKTKKLMGANVTLPYKCEVIKYMDELCPIAKKCGAVNTIYLKENRLIGSSTDGIGAILSLEQEGVYIEDLKIAMIGSGGAAKSVLAAIAEKHQNFIIVGRSQKKLQEMTSIFGGKSIHLQDKSLKKELQEVDLIINATSVGMYPYKAESPINPNIIHKKHIVFDLIYKPLETKLLKEAKKQGAKTINGLGMLIFQGIKAFELWTGQKPPFEIIAKAVKNASL